VQLYKKVQEVAAAGGGGGGERVSVKTFISIHLDRKNLVKKQEKRLM